MFILSLFLSKTNLIFSVVNTIIISSRISQSDYPHFSQIVNEVGATELEIDKEVDWEEAETALRNINNQKLELNLNRELQYEGATWDNIKRLAKLCKEVTVKALKLSEGKCDGVRILENEEEIFTFRVFLRSDDDVTILQDLISQYSYWGVTDLLDLEMGSVDWALVDQLLLLSRLQHVAMLRISGNSTLRPTWMRLKVLWFITTEFWDVNGERYHKSDSHVFRSEPEHEDQLFLSDDEIFDKMFNNHFI